MTDIKVKDGATGAVLEEALDEHLFYKTTNLRVLATKPPQYNLMVMAPDDSGLTQEPMMALMPNSLAVDSVMTLIQANDALMEDQITALQAHDVVLDEHDAALAAHDTAIDAVVAGKQDKFAGTTAQYVRGNGSLATFPTIPTMPDISGKSDKANFTALSVLAAHGQSAAATNSPTNSKTDYNIVTTLLGTLTDGLNQTNTAQNTIATNLNSLATKVNAIMTWLGLNKDAINNLKTAGAA